MAEKSGGIRAVVFDLDDTLYPERQYVRSGYEAVERHLKATLGRQEPWAGWLWRRFLSGRTGRAFNALSEQFALGLTDGQIDKLVQVYREHSPRIQPYDGVPAMLAQLRPLYRLGLLTDGEAAAQQRKLDALGLKRFFEAVVFTDEVGPDAWKPSGVGFERIRRQFELPHGACAYVADNPSKDFVAPNGLGWRTIQWLRPGQIHARKPAPEGGEAQRTIRLPGELHTALLD